jgi:hypothetical protein
MQFWVMTNLMHSFSKGGGGGWKTLSRSATSWSFPRNALMLKLYFLHIPCHNSDIFCIYIDLLQGVTEHIKNMDGLLYTLKYVHKMFVDIIKFIGISAELVCNV